MSGESERRKIRIKLEKRKEKYFVSAFSDTCVFLGLLDSSSPFNKR